MTIDIIIGILYDNDDFIEEPTKEKNRKFIICFIVFVIIWIPTVIYNILALIANHYLEIKETCFDDDTNKMIELLQDIQVMNFIIVIACLGSLIIPPFVLIVCAILIIRTAIRRMREMERDRQETLMNITPNNQKTPNSSIPLYPINS